MKIRIIISILWLSIGISHAQIQIVKDHKPQSRIVVNKNDETDILAADLLQDFLSRISGAKLPIIKVGLPTQPGNIVIGSGDVSGLTEDGFRIQTQNGCLHISSRGDKGTIYGVVTLLEHYLGVRYYAAHAIDIPQQSTIRLPEINRAENPAFRYRQSQCYAMREDPLYRLWFRLEEPEEVFAGKLWVHTFDRILPSDIYGTSHPEYYSFINGMRRPGKASQWCLTNPDVFELAAQKIDSIFKRQ